MKFGRICFVFWFRLAYGISSPDFSTLMFFRRKKREREKEKKKRESKEKENNGEGGK